MLVKINAFASIYVAVVLLLSTFDSFYPVGLLRHLDLVPLAFLVFFCVILNPESLKKFFLVFSFFLAYFLLSVVNGSPWQAAVLAVLGYKYLFFICALLYIDVDKEYMQLVLWRIVYFVVPISVVQRFYSENHTGDDVVGIFGNGGSGILTIFLSAMAFSKILNYVNWKSLLLSLYALIPVALNETKIFLVLLIVYLIYMFSMNKVSYSIKLLSFIFSLFAFFVINYYLDLIYGQGVSVLVSYDFIDSYFNSEWEGDVGRYIKYLVFYDYLLSQSWFDFLFGNGVGSSFIGKNSGYIGVVAVELSDYRIFEGTKIGFMRFVSDFGMVVFLMVFYKAIIYLWRSKIFATEFISVLSCSLILGFMVSLFYTDVLYNALYMVLLALVVFGGGKGNETGDY